MGDMSLRAVGWAQSFPVSGGVRQGRVWAREHLDALGWTHQAPDTVDAVLLTVSELITNAHVHAHSTAQLVLAWDSQCLHVSVHDSSTELPAPREAGDAATSGRGMALIDHFADSWETHHQRSGKTVTACFTPPDQPGQPDPHASDPRDENVVER
ncbi:ATP-binding protein [Streptomyces sp. SPB162]|uniref:ATP-binding protein n=1 Tax=Streptomyces sp. SPB162 TaxID=2940560 RepID=UPI002404DBA5|nr:ATP-binding protein [Streptomyces sp. SPB162]MDF9810782.1 anti-sigma regulatory factor (Ser/Thr protein kinase) [Streptomyces sp. SPB162]